MAGVLTEAVVEDVKSRTDLAALIASYGVELRRAGASSIACCPFHNEKTPSFHVNTSKGFYHCFGCGESGDAIKFVEKMDGLGFAEAVKKLAERCGVEIAEKADPEARLRKRLYALMSELAGFYRRCLLATKAAAPAREYLERRKIPPEAAEEFRIGWAPEGAAPVFKWAEKNGFTPEELEAAGVVRLPSRPGDTGYHRFAGRLMFPIADRRGRIVAFSGRLLQERKNAGKYVNSPETPIFVKGRTLFAFDRAAGEIVRSPRREVICCEGQIDAIRLHTCGFKNAVASQGTAFTPEHAKMIARAADCAVLMYDDDPAGRKATVKVASLLMAEGMPVRVAGLPDGDDPDSFLLKHPPEDLRALVERAESIVSFQCRVERAKERDPGAIDAVARVTKAVLATVARSPSAVLRAAMSAEAAKLLGLPPAAVADELNKTATKAKPAAEKEQEEEPSAEEEHRQEAEAFVGEDAAKAAPPSPLETAWMAFLIAIEDDPETAKRVATAVPPHILEHPFSREFESAWLAGRATEENQSDPLAAFADALDERRRAWFDSALEGSGRTGPCGLAAGEVLEDFARNLWYAALLRQRGALPAADGAADAERFALTADLKRFRQAPWSQVEQMIAQRAKGE